MDISEPGYTGTFTTQSSSPQVATATIFDNILTVTAKQAGSTIVSVSDQAGNTSKCNVTVN